MPCYEYRCPSGHITMELRVMHQRHVTALCRKCGERADLILSRPHSPPSGVYSYEPNIGDPIAFEQRQEAIKNKQLRTEADLRPREN